MGWGWRGGGEERVSKKYSGDRPPTTLYTMEFCITVAFTLIRLRFPKETLFKYDELRFCQLRHSYVNAYPLILSIYGSIL